MQTASEIPSFLPEKKLQKDLKEHWEYQKNEGFNQAIDQIAPKRLEVVIDREMLALELWKQKSGFLLTMNACYKFADSLILASKDKELCRIEVVE